MELEPEVRGRQREALERTTPAGRPTVSDGNLWERQSGETAKAFHAFEHLRNAVRARPFHPGGAGRLSLSVRYQSRHHRASGMDGAQSISGSTALLSMIPTLPLGAVSAWQRSWSGPRTTR